MLFIKDCCNAFCIAVLDKNGRTRERREEMAGTDQFALGEEALDDQPVIEVLLATYNGERFLREQVESILAQDYGNLRVLARDDGSSDETVKILNEYAARYPDRFRVMPLSPGTGSAKENFLLLSKASRARYICFSDQDDVWLPDKLTRTKQAMDELELHWGADVPLLVFTDLQVVDEKRRTLHHSFWAHEKIDPNRINRLSSLVVQNVVTGCTAMLNRRLLELSLAMPNEAMMHDHWIALLASSLGRSGVIRAQTVLYRQHDRNVFGATKDTKSLPDLVHRIRRSKAREMQWKLSQRQAEALLKTYYVELSEKNRNVLKAYLRCGTSPSRVIRIATLVRYRFLRIGIVRNLATMHDLWQMHHRESE
jgi:glycosyltransferase involved in cell wall biosynthesis